MASCSACGVRMGVGLHPDPGRTDLKPIIFGLGVWGQRWVEARTTLKNLDPSLLMWDMRRNLDPTPMPPRRAVIQIVYPELLPARRTWWLIVEGGARPIFAPSIPASRWISVSRPICAR